MILCCLFWCQSFFTYFHITFWEIAARPYVLFVFRLFAILVLSRLDFEGTIWALSALVPGRCILCTFIQHTGAQFVLL